MHYHIIQLCKSSAAIEALPKHKASMDLNEVEKLLANRGYQIVCNAKAVLIVQNNAEISIYPSGKLLIKTKDEALARDEIERITPFLI